MPTHTYADGTLTLSLAADLDVPDRASTLLRMQSLVLAHRPERVLLHLTPGAPGPAAQSVLARLHRLCKTIGTPLTVTEPPPTPPPDGPASPTLPTSTT